MNKNSRKALLAIILSAYLAAGVQAHVSRAGRQARKSPPSPAQPAPAPKQLARSGIIEDSLWDSMTSKGVPPQVIMAVAALMEDQIDFLTEVRTGDQFAVVWHAVLAQDTSHPRYEVDAFAYDGDETGRETAFHYDGGYYDEKAHSLRRQFLRAPLSFAKVTSTFSNHRFHPVLKIYRPHHGTDYKAAPGTPVSVVGDGTVTFTGWRGGLGRYVEVRHDAVYTTGYGHLSRFAKNVARGAHVKQGQVIAYSGCTGLASGPHLHFQVTERGKFIDFSTIKKNTESRKLGAGKRKAFLAYSRPLLRKLKMGLAVKPKS